jgi:hypothetical protein
MRMLNGATTLTAQIHQEHKVVDLERTANFDSTRKTSV